MGSIAGLTLSSPESVGTDYGKWLIHGSPGSGKTFLGSTIAQVGGKTLYIDMRGERGARSFASTPWSANIEVVRPTSIKQFFDLFNELNKGTHDYRAVIIDSLTAVQQSTMRFLLGFSETEVRQIKERMDGADQRTWGMSLDIMRDIATFWYSLADSERKRPIHVVMTAQTKIIEDETNETISRVPDVQRGAVNPTIAAADYVVYTETEDDFDTVDADGNAAERHIVRFGNDVEYRIKARVPAHLHGRIPRILGRGKAPLSLTSLSRTLGIGGISAETSK